MTRIAITPGAWKQMVEHALATYPEECCGALLGRLRDGRKSILRALPCENSAGGDRTAGYAIDLPSLFKAEACARAGNLEVLGIYHSHPDSGANFSESDLRNSCPWYSYVVLGVRKEGVTEAKSFLPSEDGSEAREEAIERVQ